MRQRIARALRKLAAWIDPNPPAPPLPPIEPQGGGPGSTPPPPQAD